MHSLSEERLSIEFRDIANLCDQGPVTLGRILIHLERRGHAILTLFLGGPFLLPLPLPGLSIPFGILIFLFALAIVLGSPKPFLPESWLAREIPRETLIRFCRTAYRFFVRFERLFRPRIPALVESRASQMAIASMIGFCGVLLALPLPPGTNAPPAAVIVSLSIGFLERDGILAILGSFLFCFNIVFFGALAFLGYEGAIRLLNFFN